MLLGFEIVHASGRARDRSQRYQMYDIVGGIVSAYETACAAGGRNTL